jgi:integrase/recombinase XerD
MTPLSRQVEQYVQVRRALGCKLEREGRLLPDFVAFLERHGATYITSELALRWATMPASATPWWWATRLSMVRRFAQYVYAFDGRTEIPSRDLLPSTKSRRLTPYVYSEDDVLALMGATHMLSGLMAHTYATLIGLLMATGMRVGEVLALDRTDIDWQTGILVVRHAKFGKSRELPLHPTTVQALLAYKGERDRCLPRQHSPGFLLSLAGTRLLYKNVHFTFLRLLHQAGLAERRPRRPRIHDMRHTFAIKALLRWYREGADVSSHLPALSTYLGHVLPSHTYWYITATPELMQLAAGRLEYALGERS